MNMIFIGYDYLNDEIEWRKIYWKNGEVTKYSISNIGVVRNDITDKILRARTDRDYVRVSLTHKGKHKEFLIHRLVATSFIPNPENKPQVNHINGIKHCNYVYNLEWVTASENCKHAHENGLYGGKVKKHKKLSDKKIHKVCKLLEKNELTYSEIAKRIGCDRRTVSDIRKGKKYTRISSEYDLSKYVTKKTVVITGDKAIHTKYSDDDIRNLCELIDSNQYELPQLESVTGIPYQTIRNVYYGTCRNDISESYNFRKNKNPLYNKKREAAIKVCELLYTGLNTRQVSEKLGVPRGFARKILSGETWKDISKNYGFTKYDNRKKGKVYK